MGCQKIILSQVKSTVKKEWLKILVFLSNQYTKAQQKLRIALFYESQNLLIFMGFGHMLKNKK